MNALPGLDDRAQSFISSRQAQDLRAMMRNTLQLIYCFYLEQQSYAEVP